MIDTLLTFFKSYLKISSSPCSSLVTLTMHFIIVCAVSCLLLPLAFLLADFSGLNEKLCAMEQLGLSDCVPVITCVLK